MLTVKQAKVLNKISTMTHVGTKFKNGWNKTWNYEGVNRHDLNALVKRGLIVLQEDYYRETGVYNPKADSWGYSRERYTIYATKI